MATEGNVWSNDVGNGRLHLYWWLDGSTINWWLKFSKDDSNYRRLWNYAVYRNDSWIAGSSTQRDVYDGDTIDSGSFNISQLGSNGYLKFYIEGGIGQSSVNATGEDAWTVPVYAQIYVSVDKITVNSVKINWSTDANVDQFQYKIGSGSWINAETYINKSSGSFVIPNLTPNTNYNIYFDAKRTDSQQWSTWGNKGASVTAKTKQIASCVTIDFNLGSSAVIALTTPDDGSVIQGAIYNSDGTVVIAPYRNISGTAYYFSFTDEEKDNLYKMFGTATQLNLRVYISTTQNGQTYYSHRTIRCYLSGNQKTGHINVNGTWKRTKKWVNVNGTWKRCLRWVNVDGTWKRCI